MWRCSSGSVCAVILDQWNASWCRTFTVPPSCRAVLWMRLPHSIVTDESGLFCRRVTPLTLPEYVLKVLWRPCLCVGIDCLVETRIPAGTSLAMQFTLLENVEV